LVTSSIKITFIFLSFFWATLYLTGGNFVMWTRVFIAYNLVTTYNKLYCGKNTNYRTSGITGMDFFGIGLGEIVLIIIVALIVFGPGKTVEVARSLGKFVRNVKKMSSDFTSTITKEIDEQPGHAKKIPYDPQEHAPEITEADKPTENNTADNGDTTRTK
jgi:sec-independent protein translocase protein TatA